MKTKKLIPNDFRDFLSIVSFIVFLGIFLSFSFNINWISNNFNAIFLFLGGISFLVVGKAFQIKSWIKDGIQINEFSQILSIIIGLSSLILGILFFIDISIPERLFGYVGIIALIPAVYTLIDYYKKNLK